MQVVDIELTVAHELLDVAVDPGAGVDACAVTRRDQAHRVADAVGVAVLRQQALPGRPDNLCLVAHSRNCSARSKTWLVTPPGCVRSYGLTRRIFTGVRARFLPLGAIAGRPLHRAEERPHFAEGS